MANEKQRERHIQREMNQDESRISLRSVLVTPFTEIGKISGETTLRKKIMISILDLMNLMCDI